uniref:Uncharacterized protein n=1 Tax=Pseudomonas fluorescens (strain SBW25) TaxID=216595 RepID=A4V7I9_PSEFS|nr:hypothetical protein [Pseudomonas fluorescens]CAM96126.1 hypothetical protein pQBR0094 [Pseudomonas fluorescens SBW25]
MLLKELVFALRQLIAEKTGEKPSVGHTYEMLSALLGYDSFASLNSQAFIVSLSGCDANAVENVRLLLGGILDLRGATNRHLSLKASGSPRPIAQVVETFAQQHELVAIPLTGLLELCNGYEPLDDATEFAIDELHNCILQMSPPQLRLAFGMLEDHSAKNPSVHYVIHRIYSWLLDCHDTVLDYDSVPNFWLRQARSGLSLSVDQQRYADKALFAEGFMERMKFHLSKAASSGHTEAMLVELEGIDRRASLTAADLAVFDPHASTPGLAGRVAVLAEEAGLSVFAESWLRRAAAYGDFKALDRLVSANCSAPTVETWTWIYLSRLLGNDPTASTLRAYHAGGLYADEEYDQDQGGDFYVEGRERLEVAPLNPDLDAEAQAAAASFYERIPNAHPST